MEADLCRRLERGAVTQKDAIAEELPWFKENLRSVPPGYFAAISPV